MDRILSAYEFAIEVAARGAFGRRPSVYEEHKVVQLDFDLQPEILSSPFSVTDFISSGRAAN